MEKNWCFFFFIIIFQMNQYIKYYRCSETGERVWWFRFSNRNSSSVRSGRCVTPTPLFMVRWHSWAGTRWAFRNADVLDVNSNAALAHCANCLILMTSTCRCILFDQWERTAFNGSVGFFSVGSEGWWSSSWCWTCVCVLQSVSKSAWLCIRWTNITLRASVRQTNIYSRVTVS